MSERARDPTEMDTVVCPARKKGFKNVFKSQDERYAIRVSSKTILRIDSIATYETAPTSTIKWIGIVENIEPHEDTGKYRVILSEKIETRKSHKTHVERGQTRLRSHISKVRENSS